MKLSSLFCILILFACYANTISLDPLCGSWLPFKDEKCIGILDDTTRTFVEAEKACAKLEDASSTLVVIHTKEEQEFLSNYLFNISKKVEDFWIGAKVVNSKVNWIDNTPFSFINWDPKGPRNKVDYCVQMQSDEAVVGKWLDEPCIKPNLVVCQRMQTWSLARLQKTLLDARKELRDGLSESIVSSNKKINDQQRELNETNKALDATKHELDISNKKISDQQQEISNLKQMLENSNIASNRNISELRQSIIPIGFIYTQIPSTNSPTEIWPSFTWTDVSDSYAGVFFRVNGGGAESFGSTQAENAPRITQVERVYDSTDPGYIKLDVDSVSNWIYTGDNALEGRWDKSLHLRFTTSGGEVRPRNMAIRVWKRTG